ncbi:GDSL esterase/lipase At3g27950 isoform X2 [Cryptomeria japonica]|nr:GDSL esterase/lipase At3g27950 isoform X2 [Cryptomeria japonica]
MAYWKKKSKKQLLLVLVSIAIIIFYLVNSGEAKAGECKPPLFVFGASMLDVGENQAARPGREASEFPPYGLHYFGRPAARYSNGRLLIDFISQGLGYGLVDPYLRSEGSNFKRGANFASSGATFNSTFFSLSVQIDQFRFFKAAELDLNLTEGLRESILTIEDFSEGVYMIQIGHNDYKQFFSTNPGRNGNTFVIETIQLMKEALMR